MDNDDIYKIQESKVKYTWMYLQKYKNTRKVLDCNDKVSYKISQNIQLPSNDTT